MLKIYADGGCSKNPGGHIACGVHVLDDSNKEIKRFGLYLGCGTNNEAEFGAAIEAFKWLLLHNYEKEDIKVFMDSVLVVNIYNNKWKCKKDHLKLLLGQLRGLTAQFKGKIIFEWVKRDFNTIADEEASNVLDIIKETS